MSILQHFCSIFWENILLQSKQIKPRFITWLILQSFKHIRDLNEMISPMKSSILSTRRNRINKETQVILTGFSVTKSQKRQSLLLSTPAVTHSPIPSRVHFQSSLAPVGRPTSTVSGQPQDCLSHQHWQGLGWAVGQDGSPETSHA